MSLKRARIMLGIVVFGLFVSGVTVWPVESELVWGVRFFWGDGPATGNIHSFVLEVIEALRTMKSQYPCIPLRGLPLTWFWIDFAFAPAAALPLWIALRDIRNAEKCVTAA